MSTTSKPAAPVRLRWQRVPLLLLGMLALASGIWGGLLRLPVPVPMPTEHANWLSYHGPLMVCGFLGTVIGLERAVALGKAWTYLAPLLTGVAGLMVAGGSLGWHAPALFTAGSVAFFAVTVRIVTLQRATHTLCLAAAALCWVTGNVLWLFDWPFPRIVLWWVGFLLLTITGERLELNRLQRLPGWAPRVLVAVLATFVAGAALSAVARPAGEKIAGIAMLGAAVWLVRFDIARRTVRERGLPRFMAVCLLSGYFWLGAAGLQLIPASPLESGVKYDAALHAFFLGFTFSMIFGHAPVIFPAVLGLPIRYRATAYLPLVLLHGSLLMRVGADHANWLPGRQWAAVLNSLTIGLFLANMVLSFLLPPPAAPASAPRSRA